MAARLRKDHDQYTRDRIQITKIVEALQNSALGKTKVPMSSERTRQCEILLKKVLPDLSSVEMNTSGAVMHNVVSAKPLTEDQWAKAYGAEDDTEPVKTNGRSRTKH